MKKITIAAIAALLTLVSSCRTDSTVYPTTFAHRGCWISNYIPENSLDGVRIAARYGYPTVECDVKFTSDSVLVLMHDASINRTMRNADDYSKIKEKVVVKNTPFKVLRDKYILASDTLSCRKPIPTFAEFMDACEAEGIIPILHCDIYEGYVAAKERLDNRWIAFTEDYGLCLKVRELDRDVTIFYSPKKQFYGSSADELIKELNAIGGSCGISSMHYPLMRKGVCDSLRTAGYLTQSSIFPIPHEMEAIANGADVILSDFCWFPAHGMKPSTRFRISDVKELNETFDKVEYAGMVLKVSCNGEYRLKVNGCEKEYVICNGGEEVLLGYRLFGTEPSIELKPADDNPDAEIKYVKIDFYRL